MKLFLYSIILSVVLPVTNAAQPAAAPAPGAMIAYMGGLTGSVQVQLGGSDIWSLAKLGQQLPRGTQIKTEDRSSCIVVFSDQSKVRLGARAAFKLEEVSPSKVSVFIGLGKLEVWVKKLATRSFQARNPVSVASVRGTIFAMDVLSPTSVTVDCFEGSVAVQDNFGNTSSVAQGQRVEANATTGASAPAPVPVNVARPVEPTVTVPPPGVIAPPPPPAAAKPPVPQQTQAAPPPDEVPAETETTAPSQDQPPPPNPQQETTTPVSPSAP
ncbi:MAG TPA: hypothetical protein DEB40_10115 [Elusimicrobia bacterium]|nr:hypothetical protein [Elusimicrobiota bacterium]HBT62084.1 hypothetical protein [Elusimicrobiota bacterium]